MGYQNYELKGSYFTAGEDTPMYSGLKRGDTWSVNPRKYDVLKKGKTFPMQIAGTMEVNGRQLFYTTPIEHTELGGYTSTFFENKPNTVESIAPTVTGKGGSYYTPPSESTFEKIGGSIKTFGLLALAAWVAKSFFEGRKK